MSGPTLLVGLLSRVDVLLSSPAVNTPSNFGPGGNSQPDFGTGDLFGVAGNSMISVLRELHEVPHRPELAKASHA